MHRILIRQATCVLPSETVRTDVLIEGETITRVGAPVGTRADEVVSAQGLVLMPGVVDDQVHFREPGDTHKEDLVTGSRACAKGGVTTFLEMPNTRPPTITRERLAEKLALAASRCRVNYGFYMGATANNVNELKGAARTPGIKIFIGSSTGDLLVDEQDALEAIFAETSLPITAHCEDEATIRANAREILLERGNLELADHSRIRDRRAAQIAATRAFDLARRHRHRFHLLHTSTAEEMALMRGEIGRAEEQGVRPWVTAEACPHHLFFNTGDYERLGSRVQMNPSIKSTADNEALWRGLLEGAVQVVATDHAPHTLEEKARIYPESPSGLPAVENSLALMLDQVHHGRCTLEQVVRWMCDAPARVWDLVGKGRIAEGYDADLVLVDLAAEHTVLDAEQLTRCGWSPWHGRRLTGRPVRTWVIGQTVYREGRVDDAVRGREAVFDHARGGYWATG